MVKSCGVTFNNRQIIFGGEPDMRQILEVKGCKLETLGSLGFDFTFGGCTITPSNEIVLCFHDNANENKRCRKAPYPRTDPWVSLEESHFGHAWMRIASSTSKRNLYISCFTFQFLAVQYLL